VVEPLQVRLSDKSVYVVLNRNEAFWEQCSSGGWESETFAIFKRFIDDEHSYVDIGAWIGPTLLYGCQLAKRAYGIEPDPIAFAELKENIACNRPLTDNVRLFNLCITAVSGKVAFGSRGEGGDSQSSLLFSDKRTRWTVDGLKFEDFMQENGIDDCNFIKIDIEGGEYEVLSTMKAYLRKHRPTVYLSLHPCFLGGVAEGAFGEKIINAPIRLKNTFRLMWCLRFYRHFYDPYYKFESLRRGNFRVRIPRIHYYLSRMSWWPLALLRAVFFSTLSWNSTLVLTDLEWG
jgi:FkbM family methyltransferase